jgi:hypothetical protein
MYRWKMLPIAVLMLALSVPYVDDASATIAGGGISLDADVDSRMTASGTYAGQLVGTSQILVEFECNAVAVGVVASMSMDCVLYAGNGAHAAQSLATPGNVIAAAGTAVVPLAPMKVCWTARATWVVGGTSSTTIGCSVSYPIHLLPDTDTEASDLGGLGA